MLGRFLLFGLFGCAVEYAFTVLARRPKLPSLWMAPLYGIAAPLFPPLRATLASRPPLERAATYGLAMIAAEYTIGRALRGTILAVPWTYSGSFAIDGLTRLDYLPLWALYGLALERVDDAIRPQSARSPEAG